MLDRKLRESFPEPVKERWILTRFLNCLWMASSASLMVTPFMFRATTSRPSGKWSVIFLTLGVHNGIFRTAGSSTLEDDSFSFLRSHVSIVLRSRLTVDVSTAATTLSITEQ